MSKAKKTTIPGVDVDDLITANNEFSEENTQLRAELAKLRASNASNTPVFKSKGVDAREYQIGQDGTASFDDGDLIHVETKTLDDPRMQEKLSTEAFMNEMVEVRINDSAEQNADMGFAIYVNGKPEIFRQGEQRYVKRMYVEGLARAKKTSFANVFRVDPGTGEKEYVYPSKTGLRYGFSVVTDRNKNGATWLESVLRQP